MHSTTTHHSKVATALWLVAFMIGSVTTFLAQGGYELEVETVAVHDSGELEGYVTYRLYINMMNPTDYLSSCSGDADNPLVLESSSGSWYNNPASTTWNASAINPAFFAFFPELAFDSFLTIGAEDATAPASEHPSTIWGSNNATDEFVGGDGNNITVDDATGGAWYLPFPGIESADTHVGFAGEDLRVLVAQFTTTGVMSGQIYVQVFVQGSQGNEFRDLITFETVVGPGCTDETACNYDPNATEDDGSCEFESCQWCDDPEACNFGDGTPWTANTALCEYIEEGACDCDGNVLDAAGVCGGGCSLDADGDGVCDDVDECVGELDECGVCNGPGAIFDCGCAEIPGGDCDCNGNQVDALGVCGGGCLADADGDGWCDECIGSTPGVTLETEVVAVHTEGVLMGMTTYRVYVKCLNPTDYVNSCAGDNDNPLVLESTSGEWYNDPSNTGWNAQGINPAFLTSFPELAFDSFLTIGAEDASTSAAQHPSSVWGDIDASVEFVSGNGSNVTVNDATGGAWYTPFPGLGAADSHVAFAGDDLRVLVAQITTAGSVSGQIYLQVFLNGDQADEVRQLTPFNSLWTDCENLDPCVGVEDECGVCNGPGAIFECGCSVIPAGDCDCEGNQLDAVGVCGGNCVEDVDGDGVCDLASEGCTDETACNYAPALEDDGSCEYAEPYYDCDGVCLSDSDGDGVCDELEVVGCSDETACNYNPDATDEGDCEYAAELYDCEGNCLNDTDGDGVCDELEVPGCTDEEACNYDASATNDDGSCEELDACGECGGTGVAGCTDEMACNFNLDATCDDGMCTYSETYYNCDGNCLNDTDGDGVCDELEVVGCQDETACNYDELATDEGDCVFAEEYYDCGGNCLNDTDGDGICDELEVPGCTDEAACNFDPAATDDDDSCIYPGDACDDGDDTTINDALDEECDCVGEIVDGLGEADALSWTLYPSPVRDVLNLRLEGALNAALNGDVELMVLGATGQVLLSERLAGRTQLDVSDLASGIYFLTLRSPAMATTTRRFVVAGGE